MDAAADSSPRLTFVLVPGVGHGAWFWHPVARRLLQSGHDVVAVTLPGTAVGSDPAGVAMEDAVAHVVEQARSRGSQKVVLVAHSWGGYPVTGAAHRLADLVQLVVYVSGVVPRRGSAMLDEFPAQMAGQIREVIAASPDRTVDVTFENVAQAFMPDQPEPVQRLVFELLTPVPGAYQMEALDVDPVTSVGIPAAYLLAVDDQALAIPGAEFAARLGVEPTMIPGSHEAPLTHPEEVTRALLEAVATSRGQHSPTGTRADR